MSDQEVPQKPGANNCTGLRYIKNGVGGENKTDNTSLVQMVLKNTDMD